MSQGKTIRLIDGAEIPWIGWGNGTGQSREDPIIKGKLAIKEGLNHIDTAQGYNNEQETAATLREASVPKEQVWLTSKLSLKDGGTDTSPPIEPSDVEAKVSETIKNLGHTPNLFLVHNPFVFPEGKIQEGWQALVALKKKGVLKSIGVSNFRPQDFKALDLDKYGKDDKDYIPAVNQLEFHPYVLTHLEPVIEIHHRYGIVTSSYGPLSPVIRAPEKSDNPILPTLTKIAERYSKAQGKKIDETAVLLLWCRAKDVVAITTTSKEERIKAFAEIYTFPPLSAEEVKEIDSAGRKYHFRAYPEHMCVDFPVPKDVQELE